MNDSRNYFINRYPDYDLFLFCQMKPKNVNYLSDASGIIMNGTDSHYLVDFENNSFYCILRFFILQTL